MHAPSPPEPLPAAPAIAGHALAALACLSSIGLMLPVLDAGPLVLDEHGSYWMIDAQQSGSVLERSMRYAAIPPLSSWLQLASLRAFGHSEWAFRLPSAVCHVLATMCVWRAGLTLGGAVVGGLAALLFAWHPEVLDEVRIARSYGLAVFLAAAVVWAALEWRRRHDDWRPAAGWTVACVALLWTHYAAGLLVIGSGLALPWSWARGTPYWLVLPRSWLYAIGGVALGGGLLLPTVLRVGSWAPHLDFGDKAASVLSMIGPIWWLGGLWLVVTTWGARRLLTETPLTAADRWLLCASSLAPLFVLLGGAFAGVSSLGNPRYRIALAPAWGLWLAWSGARSCRATRATAGVFGLLVVCWLLSPARPWELQRLADPGATDWKQAALMIEAQSSPGAPVFVQSGLNEAKILSFDASDPEFLEYVACRMSRFYLRSEHPRWGLPFFFETVSGGAEEYRRLAEQARDTGVAWVAAAVDTDLNRHSLGGISTILRVSGATLTPMLETRQMVLLRVEWPQEAAQ